MCVCLQDTQDFIQSFQGEAPLRKGALSTQDMALQQRVRAQVTMRWHCDWLENAALYPHAHVIPYMSVSLNVPCMHVCASPQLRAALYDVHDIFFEMPLEDRLALLQMDRELRTERKIREMVTQHALSEVLSYAGAWA